MHPELEKLIEMVITDGQVTDKERAVVIKKAISLDVDPDEAEIFLDGKLHQLATVSVSTQPAAKSNKEGEIKKCPNCGSSVNSFILNCVDCGHEFRNIKSSSAIELLFQEIKKIENTRSENVGDSFWDRMDNGNKKSGQIEAQKRAIIREFPIPNSKEDILEFLFISVPKTKYGSKWSAFWNGQKGSDDLEMSKIWKEKCEQVILKARFLMKNDPKTLEEIEYYAIQLGIK